MTIFFTDEEIKYIDTSKGRWTIKHECPFELKKRLESKINAIYK